jgi:hypothetical protein
MGGLCFGLVLVCCIKQQYPFRSPAVKHDFRQFYQPQTSHPPRWLRRIWLWF